MSRHVLGKTLLRNVIRHTDAHNKIQEEMEMWKMRDWEVHRSQSKHPSDPVCVRGSMHCDRGTDQTGDARRRRVSEHDDREARYWSRKLYEFEAKDPDRWGHGGFKELYPEEFESDGSTKKHKRKRSKSDTEGSASRHSKKSSRKSKRKKKKKKDEDVRRKRVKRSSSSSSSSSDGDKQGKKRTKSRHKDKKSVKTRGRDDDSSWGGSDEGERRRRTHSRKKRKQDFLKDSDSGLDSKRKAAAEGSSEGSCAN